MSKIVRYRNEKLFTVYQCRVDVPEVVGVHDYERRLIVPFGTFHGVSVSDNAEIFRLILGRCGGFG